MKKLGPLGLFLLLMFVNLSVFSETPTVDRKAQRDFIQKYVLYAKGYIEKNGKVKSVTDFNNATQDAVRKGLYIFGFVCGTKKMDGFTLINPGAPERIYKDTSEDPVVQQLMQAALAHPEGIWHRYPWMNPSTKKEETKESFVIFLPKEELCIGSGFYY